MTREKRRRRGGRASQRAEVGNCRSCGATPPPAARFCHRCGAAFDGASATTRHGSTRRSTAIYLVAALSVVGATLAAALLTHPDRGGSLLPPTENAAAPSMVDLSTMTPRQAADRLFNRVMSASERGDAEEAARFAPMAVAAYGRVTSLDADARYHLGLLYRLLGDLDQARRQIELLKREAPGHLLALLLEHDVETLAGDEPAAARAAAEFMAGYDLALANARPEYEAHRSAIERFHSRFAPPGSGSRPAALVEEMGADLFQSRCAECHGAEATGTDRGPPLLHPIYQKGHHNDESFFRAVREGVRSHHWSFGDMPPVAGISDAEISRIIAYVRGLQNAKGNQ